VQEGLLDQCFFNKTVDWERYVQAILGQFFTELPEEERLHGCWFQQESATVYTACMQALPDVFRDRIISSGIWPACSPQLQPCDFFFWVCLKDEVYKSNPKQKNN
jgi:hypothetical protein